MLIKPLLERFLVGIGWVSTSTVLDGFCTMDRANANGVELADRLRVRCGDYILFSHNTIDFIIIVYTI